MDGFGVGLAPTGDVDLKLIKLCVGESSFESSSEGGVSNGFQIGGEPLRFREGSAGRPVAKIPFDEIDAFCMEFPAVEPSIAVALIAQTKNGVREGALERVVVSPSWIICPRQPLEAFVRRLHATKEVGEPGEHAASCLAVQRGAAWRSLLRDRGNRGPPAKLVVTPNDAELVGDGAQ